MRVWRGWCLPLQRRDVTSPACVQQPGVSGHACTLPIGGCTVTVDRHAWAGWDAGDLLGLYLTEDLARQAAAAVVASDETGLAGRQVDVLLMTVRGAEQPTVVHPPQPGGVGEAPEAGCRCCGRPANSAVQPEWCERCEFEGCQDSHLLREIEDGSRVELDNARTLAALLWREHTSSEARASLRPMFALDPGWAWLVKRDT